MRAPVLALLILLILGAVMALKEYLPLDNGGKPETDYLNGYEVYKEYASQFSKDYELIGAYGVKVRDTIKWQFVFYRPEEVKIYTISKCDELQDRLVKTYQTPINYSKFIIPEDSLNQLDLSICSPSVECSVLRFGNLSSTGVEGGKILEGHLYKYAIGIGYHEFRVGLRKNSSEFKTVIQYLDYVLIPPAKSNVDGVWITIESKNSSADLMTIHYSPSVRIPLTIPVVGYSGFNVTEYSSVLEKLNIDNYPYQEVWLTVKKAKARGYEVFPCPKTVSCECRAGNCSCRRSWPDCVYLSKCYYFFVGRDDLKSLYNEKLKEWGGYWP
ncbi:hypothetical protein [Thermococcus sp. Bubb.Bath]|uniref:hypothetical protein n=1 Tax=Thermococcus sp. Bubb.Bath TaxID=1638242 RepID=UPI00143B8DD6|nr:hypothetical protein [Thermococcus sp. Bubb.Bath]NJF24290.1 hypothetical protein [Thermococcus sp. Bubb.Bath]